MKLNEMKRERRYITRHAGLRLTVMTAVSDLGIIWFTFIDRESYVCEFTYDSPRNWESGRFSQVSNWDETMRQKR